ncbi:MAG: glycosyltransferase family 2 protein [Paludibacteraceae bacterium]|nr:glycosyltransferase family 2 protein [Paludibacteraceae bacterium]
MICSVVILNWNGADIMRQFLPSVLQYTTLPDTEVVVVDNGSTDDSMAYLQSLLDTPEAKASHLRIIIHGKNYGFATGYNRAIASMDSEIVVLLNSDVHVSDNWLAPVLDYMRQHPNVAAAQPKVLAYKSLLAHQQNESAPITFEHAGAAGGYIDKLGYPFCRGRLMSYVAEDKGQYDTIAKTFWVSGAAFFIRTELYNKLGGLDDSFFAHMEEIDLCWRLNSRGYELVCVPQSAVYHLGGGALAYDNPRKTYLNFRNNLLMLYKNMPQPHLRRVLFCRFVLDYVAALQALLTLKPKHSRAIIRARIDFLRMKRNLVQKRQENLALATQPYPDTIARRSIIFDFYIRRLKE